MKPSARHEKLLVEEVADELVIYDQERDKAHRLNRTSALVWRHCDGQKTVDDLAAVLKSELNPAADENLVWLTLDRLSTAHLLQEPIRRSVEESRASRRQFVRRIGTIGVLSLLLPVITSIVAPPASAQVTCAGCECQTDFQCASGGCVVDAVASA